MGDLEAKGWEDWDVVTDPDATGGDPEEEAEAVVDSGGEWVVEPEGVTAGASVGDVDADTELERVGMTDPLTLAAALCVADTVAVGELEKGGDCEGETVGDVVVVVAEAEGVEDAATDFVAEADVEPTDVLEAEALRDGEALLLALIEGDDVGEGEVEGPGVTDREGLAVEDELAVVDGVTDRVGDSEDDSEGVVLMLDEALAGALLGLGVDDSDGGHCARQKSPHNQPVTIATSERTMTATQQTTPSTFVSSHNWTPNCLCGAHMIDMNSVVCECSPVPDGEGVTAGWQPYSGSAVGSKPTLHLPACPRFSLVVQLPMSLRFWNTTVPLVAVMFRGRQPTAQAAWQPTATQRSTKETRGE
jgi:hypothetical protein